MGEERESGAVFPKVVKTRRNCTKLCDVLQKKWNKEVGACCKIHRKLEVQTSGGGGEGARSTPDWEDRHSLILQTQRNT